MQWTICIQKVFARLISSKAKINIFGKSFLHFPIPFSEPPRSIQKNFKNVDFSQFEANSMQLPYNSSEKLNMICTSEKLQDLPYFWNTKTHVVILFFFISCCFILLPYECPGLCWHRPGHSLWERIKISMK